MLDNDPISTYVIHGSRSRDGLTWRRRYKGSRLHATLHIESVVNLADGAAAAVHVDIVAERLGEGRLDRGKGIRFRAGRGNTGGFEGLVRVSVLV